VTVSGCVQKGPGLNQYILTSVNRPTAPADGDPTVVARERTRAAARAYRLDAKRDQNFGELVGKQVSIVGKIEDSGNFVGTRGTGKPPDSADAHAVGSKSKRGLDSGDLAKVAVMSVTKTADSCK